MEANLTNPSHGDRDSEGWRQERKSFYKNPTNLNASINRFYSETKRADKGQSSGALAQAVQRSGFPARYNQRAGEAGRLLRKNAGRIDSVTTSTRTIPGQDRSGDRRELLTQYLATRHDPTALLSLLRGLKDAQDTPSRTKTTSSTTRSGSAPSPKGGNEDKKIVEFSKFAHSKGVKTTSAKRPTVMTASGNVSDHYAGNKSANARDWSGTPQQMDAVAKAIARRLGVKNYTGGPLTVRKGKLRYQLLWKTNVGGNHYDHVHLGIKKEK